MWRSRKMSTLLSAWPVVGWVRPTNVAEYGVGLATASSSIGTPFTRSCHVEITRVSSTNRPCGCSPCMSPRVSESAKVDPSTRVKRPHASEATGPVGAQGDAMGANVPPARCAPWRSKVHTQLEMKIALIAPPWVPVPPPAYGGTEAVIDRLARGFQQRGHEVLLFATGDSTCTVPRQFVYEHAEGERMGVAALELRHLVHAYEAVQ